MTDLEMTGVHRWRRFLIQLLERGEPAIQPEPAAEDVYRSKHLAGTQDRTVRLDGPRIAVVTAPAPRVPDISLEQATQRIPLLDRVRTSLGLPEQEALIYDRLAGGWRALPGGPVDEGPATDHTADAVRLPTLDQEGGESRD